VAVSSDPRVGSEFLGYRIEELLGRGGMGVVYRAYDPRLKRSVALKLLAPEYASDERFRERFLRETELAASLEHPNVVPIHDAGEVSGQLYLVMRYVEGEDLKRLLQEAGRLEPTRALSVCAQVAEALDAAHARGLVHRDVKPSNVLLDVRGHAYLADFGLTRRLSEQAPGFDAGLSLGTPSYVAPEQIEGKRAEGEADQYSLACLLYECLAGKPPFPRGSEAATLFAHLEEEPPRLPGLEGVLAKGLAKDPALRYDSCAELVDAARGALGIAEPRRSRWPLAVAAIAIAVVGAALPALLFTRADSAAEGPETNGRLVRIDPASDDVVGTIAVGNDPSAVAVGDEGIWVASRGDGIVRRIDPETNQVLLEAPAHGKPAEIALFGGRAVVSNGPQDANVAVIQYATGREQDVISLAAGGGFFGSARVGAGESGLWVATADRHVGQLDLAVSRILDPVYISSPRNERANAYFSGISVSEDGVWVLGDLLDPTLWRIDPATGDVAATVPLPFAPKDVAVGEGAVWVTSQLDDTVARIDPETNAITAIVPVGRGAAGVAVGAGAVWVANAIDGTVSRVDPSTLGVVDTIDVGGSPDDVAVGADGVWVTTREANEAVDVEAEPVAIGVLAACEGYWGSFFDESLAGAELPLLRRGATLAGTKPTDGVRGAAIAGTNVALVFGCGDDTAETALSEARRLVEQGGADILIGSTQIGEEFAIREYARKQPQVTFVDGTSAGQATTLHDPAPNFFRFSTEGAQWMAGLGDYAYTKLGWRNVVTVADHEGFNYAQVAGFLAEFCALGGNVLERIWVPPGTQDYSPYIAQVPPRGVDGFLLTGYPSTTLAFTAEVPQLQGNLARRAIASILLPDLLDERFSGVRFGAPIPFESSPRGQRAWRRYNSEFGTTFPNVPGPSVFGVLYSNAMEAVLQAFEAEGGELGRGQRRFRAALAGLVLDAPNGRIRLDGNRQAVAQTYLHRYEKNAAGGLNFRVVGTVPDVEQTFGGYFRTNGPLPSQTYPPCKHGNPPPWTRR